ncbi:MAG: tRNA (adenosine(37)-N6)-dimethylallyltransferase MiaA [Muribaculum sp.]|nr:tRNA (adenosine(37)-N6)-dimethylallyltransferase MiaA [Muribaculum sp.]
MEVLPIGKKPLLIVVTGPTGSGKTDLSIQLACRLRCEIISADSRQIYRGIPVGTAAPSPEQLAAVRHHFVGTLGLCDYYSASRFEQEVLPLLPELFVKSGGYAVMCGGSMMYVDAVVNGMDELPTVSEDVRRSTMELYEREGIEGVRAMLRNLDPDYLADADPANHKRLVHAVEVSIEAGVPYSSLRTGIKKERPFRVLKMMIDYPREELFDRINRRVDAMIEAGLEEEARRVYPLRHLNSLNTVGYKEMFSYFDGVMPYDVAVARIAKNTRVYAKKQLTWLRRDPAVVRLDPSRPLLDQALHAIHAANDK